MILRQIRRLVEEKLKNGDPDRQRSFVEGLRNSFSWLILAVPGWILSNFFQPITFNFLIAAICFALSSCLLWYRWYRSAAVICGALAGYCLILSLTATYILATDQQGIRYGQVGNVSYLELPSNSPVIDLLPSKLIHPRLISVITCDGMKVAKLPLLPFTATKADRTQFDSPLQFRRLPLISYDGLEAYIETFVGESDGRKEIGFGASFARIFRDVNITSIFPRSISCMENFVPLIPVMEILPWNPDQTNQLISTVAKVFSFRDVYVHGTTITPQIIRTLSIDNDESVYKSLLDFTSDSILSVVLQGNLLAESRADIKNRLCITIESNPGAFSGPFSSLSKLIKREIAYSVGRTFRSIYPACHIDDDVFNEIDTLPTHVQELPNWITAMSNCSRSQTPGELLSCLGDSPFYHRKGDNCEARYCGAALTGAISPEDVVGFYEKPFDNHVVSREGSLIEPSTLDNVECPTLRDTYEDLYLLNWRAARAWSIWDKPVQCTSPEWQSRFMQAKEASKAELRCAREKGFGGPTDDDTDMVFDLSHMSYCDPSFDKLKNQRALTDVFQLFDHLAEFKIVLMNYADWIDPRRVKEMLEAATQMENVKTLICGNGNAKQCIAYFGDASTKRLTEMLGQSFGPIPDGSDPSSKMRATFDALSKSDNFIVRIAICDILARSDISQVVGVSREAFCRSHGLSRYMAVSEHVESAFLERTFRGNGAQEFFSTSESRLVFPNRVSKSYGREWMRKFPSR
jgi:hypothetical protein